MLTPESENLSCEEYDGGDPLSSARHLQGLTGFFLMGCDNLHILVQMVKLIPNRELHAFATIKEEDKLGNNSLRGLREPHGPTGSSEVLRNIVKIGSRMQATCGVDNANVTSCHFAACSLT